MTQKNESKLKMLLTLRIFLFGNKTITDTLPNFQEFMDALDAAILQIQTNSEEHQFSSKGITDNKQQNRETLVVTTADASRKIQSYARYKKDPILLAETRFTETFLRSKSSIELVDIANGL